jgi:hypothetical protein
VILNAAATDGIGTAADPVEVEVIIREGFFLN